MSKRSLLSGLGILAGVLLLSACVSTSVAPQGASGGKIKIAVLSSRGDPGTMESKQWGFRNEIGEYMEPDLVRRLNRSGYDAKLIQSASEYTAGPDSYLLSMEITSYNPGSSAARIFVGYGAGACALDMKYSVQKGGQVVQSWEDGIGTSGDWRRLPNALNDKLVRKLNAELLSW
jgi:hypothetical protein